MFFQQFTAVGHAMKERMRTAMATGHEPPYTEKPKPPIVPIA